MKRLFIFCIAMLFITNVKAQAHLGSTEYEIRAMHTDLTWKSGYDKDGTKWISADMPYGVFYYYFSKSTKLSYLNIQIPFNQTSMNAQVEQYNKKYAIVSDTYWKAYLEGGGIILIRLETTEKLNSTEKFSFFSYESPK